MYPLTEYLAEQRRFLTSFSSDRTLLQFRRNQQCQITEKCIAFKTLFRCELNISIRLQNFMNVRVKGFVSFFFEVLFTGMNLDEEELNFIGEVGSKLY